MFEKDKVFSFFERLKLWAKAMLYEQIFQDLSTALLQPNNYLTIATINLDKRQN